MSKLFSSPKTPKAPEPPAAPPPPPTDADPAVQQAAVDKKNMLRRSGRSQTVFTSPTGVASAGPTMSKTLLGA